MALPDLHFTSEQCAKLLPNQTSMACHGSNPDRMTRLTLQRGRWCLKQHILDDVILTDLSWDWYASEDWEHCTPLSEDGLSQQSSVLRAVERSLASSKDTAILQRLVYAEHLTGICPSHDRTQDSFVAACTSL